MASNVDMRIDFVVPPFRAVDFPAIGVSNLTVIARSHGWRSRVHYENLAFLERIGPHRYHFLGSLQPNQSLSLHDFLFAVVRVPAAQRGDLVERYFAEVFDTILPAHPRVVAQYRKYIADMVPALEEESERSVARILEDEPDIAGFSLGPFQMGASLHIASCLRRARPETAIWFGGPLCAGEVGLAYLNQYAFVDAVFAGEGEVSLRDALQRKRDGVSLHGIPGVFVRGGAAAGSKAIWPEVADDLDELPVPDYDDYFATLARLPVGSLVHPYLVMESARGCWWAKKQACLFCSLNGNQPGFRTKSAPRVLSEMKGLMERHRVASVAMVDNALDPRHFRRLIPDLPREVPGLKAFWEVRCNLTREQAQALKRAGVLEIQAGVESLDDEPLALMRKGCTAAQNLQVLRWAEELGILVRYNIIYGIPGETPAAYDRMRELMAQIHHIRPPRAIPLILDRHSAYGDFSTDYGLSILGANPPSLTHCFPEEGARPVDFATSFTYENRSQPAEMRYLHGRLFDDTLCWIEDYEKLHKRLLLFDNGGSGYLEDDRFSERPTRIDLTAVEHRILQLLDTAQSMAVLLRDCHALGATDRETEAAVARLLELRVIFQFGKRSYLSLAVPATPASTDLEARKTLGFRSVSGFSSWPMNDVDPEFAWLFRSVIPLAGFVQRRRLGKEL